MEIHLWKCISREINSLVKSWFHGISLCASNSWNCMPHFNPTNPIVWTSLSTNKTQSWWYYLNYAQFSLEKRHRSSYLHTPKIMWSYLYQGCLFLSRTFDALKITYNGCKPSRQLRRDEHGSQCHREMKKWVTVRGIEDFISNDTLQKMTNISH